MATGALILAAAVVGGVAGAAAGGAFSGSGKTGKDVPNEDDPRALATRAAEVARRRRGQVQTTVVSPAAEGSPTVGRPTVVGAGAQVG